MTEPTNGSVVCFIGKSNPVGRFASFYSLRSKLSGLNYDRALLQEKRPTPQERCQSLQHEESNPGVWLAPTSYSLPAAN